MAKFLTISNTLMDNFCAVHYTHKTKLKGPPTYRSLSRLYEYTSSPNLWQRVLGLFFTGCVMAGHTKPVEFKPTHPKSKSLNQNQIRLCGRVWMKCVPVNNEKLTYFTTALFLESFCNLDILTEDDLHLYFLIVSGLDPLCQSSSFCNVNYSPAICR